MPQFFQDGTWKEVRLDIDASVKPDYLGSMTDMSAIENKAVDSIFSSHNIEHLYPHEVPIALKEFKRVLDEEGFALITCPDLQAVAKLVAEDKLLDPAYHSGMGPISPLDILYGHRASIARGNHYMAHRGGFTMKTLVAALAEAGFAKVFARRRPMNFDLWALATVRELPDEEITKLAAVMLPN
ncbi:class I SAM-dependent methyltransferase [Methylobacterium gregans]|uniref:class I SAM-dependent methyltransferase n=1 Tax=Methylobacterium gregans TaxID=374424 RepID=UPI001EE2F2A6|nr:methyltransferase domain-containing protein [Methylobacterium gregans]MDQ0521793.1 ubiquinone/menaquinone biosynthesis C-methylase UbiE [Methylobacterium gregans]